MAFKDLDTDEMVSLFSPFVVDAEMKAQFLALPDIAGLHGIVVNAYEAVVSVRPGEVVADEVLKAISASQKEVDGRHDHLARSIALFLEAQRERALGQNPADTEHAAACDDALKALLPNGTAIVNATYLAESGHAKRAETLLASAEGSAPKALLESLPTVEGETTLDVAIQWIQEGNTLGELEVAKAQRMVALKGAPGPALRVVQAARSKWIATASLLLQTLALSSASDATKDAIGLRLAEAAEKAGRRPAKKTAPSAEAVEAAPAEGAAVPAGG